MRKGPVDHFRLAQDWTSASAALATKPDPWQDPRNVHFHMRPRESSLSPKSAGAGSGFQECANSSTAPKTVPVQKVVLRCFCLPKELKQTKDKVKPAHASTRVTFKARASSTASNVRRQFIIAQFLAPDDGERDRSEVPVDRFSDSDGYRSAQGCLPVQIARAFAYIRWWL